MTTGIRVLDRQFFIPRERVYATYLALDAWVRQRYGDDIAPSSWPGGILAALTFSDALRAADWEVHEDSEGNIHDIEEYDGTGLGSTRLSLHSEVLEAIAPFVRAGSYIHEWEEEFEVYWRFDGKQVHAEEQLIRPGGS